VRVKVDREMPQRVAEVLGDPDCCVLSGGGRPRAAAANGAWV
jgi:hypothetical protein